MCLDWYSQKCVHTLDVSLGDELFLRTGYCFFISSAGIVLDIGCISKLPLPPLFCSLPVWSNLQKMCFDEGFHSKFSGHWFLHSMNLCLLLFCNFCYSVWFYVSHPPMVHIHITTHMLFFFMLMLSGHSCLLREYYHEAKIRNNCQLFWWVILTDYVCTCLLTVLEAGLLVHF